MFRQVMDQEAVRARLLALPEGERALTNALHLAEVLHEAALREKLGAGGLIQWLATRLEDQDAAEEHQLRLERDENAVQLVTVHKSKGLQYDVVFAPFCWRGSELKPGNASDDEQEVLFHDPASRGLVRDLGPDFAVEHVELAKRERLAENVRLLYVALTRARHRCYCAWGAFKGSERSAPAWLFHQARIATSWPLALSEIADDELRADLESIARASGETDGQAVIGLSDLPQAPGAIYDPKTGEASTLVPREFKGRVPRDWRVASFSGLVAGQREEAPDWDAAEAPPGAVPPVPSPVSGIFAFPRGSKAGTCLHKLFEQLDFTAAESPVLGDLTEQQLKDHGFPPAEFGEGVIAAVRNTMRVALDPQVPGFTLSQVGKKDRVTELEFCFPLRRIAVTDLVEVFARHGRAGVQGDFPEQLGRLTFSPSRGFIKGFIDLVFRQDRRFWLADWKSNWLGNRAEAYGPEALRREMSSRFYLLQYHLYVVALDRWLRLRLPGYEYARDFGGVFYLFLRGIDPARPELGVVRDKPAPELIQALGTLLFEP
jgi:exodeoxyribonuclease V beta subunit